MAEPTTALLLINLGSPDAPETPQVRAYLREFLSDPRVIDIPGPLRWALVNLIIAPFRSPKSAHAYKQIWTDDGSPLLAHTWELERRLAEELPGVKVLSAMRYGRPSLAEAVRDMRAAGITRVAAAPLYPQYASATTGSSLERLMELLSAGPNLPALTVLPPFYDHPEFIGAYASILRESLEGFEADYLLFSYHGLPERQVLASDATGSHCLRSEDCCAAITSANRFCYRAQSLACTAGLARSLELGESEHGSAFQSRLGRAKWIGPATADVLAELPARGVKRLAVACPSFTADCLETLEEIGLRGRETFLAAGGEDFRLLPCPNAHPAWVTALASMVRPLLG